MKLIILDRDGTINADRDDYVKSLEEWEPLPGALEAIARLNHAGWHVVVATNQGGLGRGLFDMATLNTIHQRLHESLQRVGGRVDAIFFCPHTVADNCVCRKPLPGLFEQIGLRYNVDLKTVATLGDSLRDLQAGAAVGCEPHLVKTGKAGELDAGALAALVDQVPGTQVHTDLAAFAEFMIARERVRRAAAKAEGAPRPAGESALDSGPGGLTS
jgi:D-glycero-D-manno-heptose 1,7-bisphosphate phosphatase